MHQSYSGKMLKEKTIPYFLVLIILLVPVISMAQIYSVGTPASLNKKNLSDLPVIHIKNVLSLEPENNRKLPVQAGYTLNVDLNNLVESGVWDSKSAIYIWRCTFKVNDAFALNIYFDGFNLGNNDRVYLYDKTKSQVRGAFTNLNNGKYLCTDFIEGDELTIELNTDHNSTLLPFDIHEIGVRLPVGNTRGFGGAGECEVHINCMEGNDWQQQKQGVARILVKEGSQTFWCTGSLINNVRQDGKPYFLTANHCGETASTSDLDKWLFYFNYESTDCQQPVFEPEAQTISGSKLVAHSVSGITNGSDFKLLLLNENVPKTYNPYYNGWNRTGNISLTGVTIHHPEGDLKMISTYTAPLVSSDFNSTTVNINGKYWRVKWVETQNGHGVTEGGSSGSPLFDAEGLIVGSLTGGSASCTFLEEVDYYGKISSSWESPRVQDSTGQLSLWLDPDNTGTLTLAGTDLDTNKITAWFNTETTTILMGESIRFVNTSVGKISSYQWQFEGGEPSNVEIKDPGLITYPASGDFSVTLRASSSFNADTLIREKYIHVLPNISPNPGNGLFKLAFGQKLPENLEIEVFDSVGKKATFEVSEVNASYLMLDLGNNRRGIYFIRFTSSTQNNTYKVVLTK
ncbi:MAG: T9SS type A sorting domain-containing protein [Bacteroidales bacterium]|nr:T9SS type A sorting domain-containing protein [Bacteroidales bacterium]